MFLLVLLYRPQTWSLFSVGLAAAIMAGASAVGLFVSVVRAIIHGGRSLLTHCRFPDAIGYSSITNECPFDPTRIYVSLFVHNSYWDQGMSCGHLALWWADRCLRGMTTTRVSTSRWPRPFYVCVHRVWGWVVCVDPSVTLCSRWAGGWNADLTLSDFFRLCPVPVRYRWTVRPAQPHS